MPKMTDDELSAIVSGYMSDAVGYADSQISHDRQKALDYYMGRPLGTEVAGRSQVVSTDVADTIESVLPSILKVFTAGDEVIEFEPVGPEDENEATQKTDMANYVFYKENDGFLLLYTWFKDALLQKNGFLKIWWDESKSSKEETYQGLVEEQYIELISQEEIEVIEHTERQEIIPTVDPMSGLIMGEQPITVHDVKIRKEVVKKQVRIGAIPPEEIIMTRNARSEEDCALIGHRTRKTRTELIEMGIKPELLKDEDGSVTTLTGEEQTRFMDEGGYAENRYNSNDKSMDEIWYTESYVRVDYDGDGVAELRQVCSIGAESYKIVKNERFDQMIPIVSITPIILSHKLIGRALAELIMDMQLIKSTVMRQWLDNMYLTNNGRHLVKKGAGVDMDALLNSRPGGVVVTNYIDAVVPLPVASLGNQALTGLEYLDTVKEGRTGITKYNQGMDANSLNKTARGIDAIMGAAQQRIELITRVFAETGVKRLFRGIIELLSKHQDVAKIIRVRNEFVTINPTEWRSENNVTINVGLGTGNKDQQLVHLNTIIAIQKEIAMSPYGQMVSAENIYNSAAEIAKNSGFKNPGKFFTKPPTAEETARQPQQPPPPNPEAMKAEAEAKQAEAKIQADKEVQMQKAQLTHDEHLQQLEFDKYRASLDAENKKQQIIFDTAAKILMQQQAPTSEEGNGNESDAMMQPVDARMAEIMMALQNTVQMLSVPKQITITDAAGNPRMSGIAAPMMGQ